MSGRTAGQELRALVAGREAALIILYMAAALIALTVDLGLARHSVGGRAAPVAD